MLAVVVRGRPRGLGSLGAFSILTPGACGFTDLGVLKPECWAISLGPGVVGQSSYNAALALQNPDVAYPTQPTPAPVPAVTDYGFPQTGAGTAEQAQAATDAAIAAAKAQTGQANVDYFSQVSSALDTLTKATAPASLFPTSSVGIWAAVGAGALLLVLIARR